MDATFAEWSSTFPVDTYCYPKSYLQIVKAILLTFKIKLETIDVLPSL
jgi:hypothetical protein